MYWYNTYMRYLNFKNVKDNFFKRLITYVFSLILLSFSTSLFIHVKHIGIAPIDIFFVELSHLLHQQVGNIILYINIVFWLFQLFVYKKLDKKELNIYFTLQLIPTLFFGMLVNLHTNYIHLINFNNNYINIICFILSFILMCVAISLMIISDIIRNPYAGFNFAIITLSKNKWKFKYIRLLNDVFWFIVSLILITCITNDFSIVNIGSLMFVVISGPLCSLFAQKINIYLNFDNKYNNNL